MGFIVKGGSGGTGGGTGPAGPAGADGSVWRVDVGAPDNSLGVDGDFYLDSSNGDVYEKSAGAYAVVANIEGPAGAAGSGAPGSTWRNGSGAPANGLGINGDYYLNNDTGDVYAKAAGVYNVVTNIIGPAGTDGIDGGAGSPGAIWYSGAGAPAGGTGINGDFYLRTSNGDVYVKSAGAWSVIVNIMGPAGADGVDGVNGNLWYTGSGAPAGGTGVNGDFYLDTNNGDVYQKVAGAWTGIANLTGPAGATGTAANRWYQGSGGPAAGLGNNDDFYYNTANDEISFKAGGVWNVIADITGAAGPAGADGADGADGLNGSVWRDGTGVPSNALGVNGDYYLNDANGDVYYKAAGVYTVVANIEGPAGSAGSAGAAGTVWYSGAGAPAGGTGVNGDYYLNTTNGDVYYKSGGAWAVIDNLTGPQGPAGGAGSGGDLVRLATVTPTAAANIDFLNTFSSTYDNYLVVFNELIPNATTTDGLNIRLAVGGAADGAANYFAGTAEASTSRTIGAATEVQIASQVHGSFKGISGHMFIENVNSTTGLKTIHGKHCSQNASTTAVVTGFGGGSNNAGVVTGFRLFWGNAWNFKAQGSVSVYGLKKS